MLNLYNVMDRLSIFFIFLSLTYRYNLLSGNEKSVIFANFISLINNNDITERNP